MTSSSGTPTRVYLEELSEGISRRTGTRLEEVWISLIDVQPENWSFGNGEMQYSPKASSGLRMHPREAGIPSR